MTSDPPYAIDLDTAAAALDELAQAADTPFDPQVVAALRQAARQPARA
jgi:HD-GYP domain-containing protein (c-di-GMP phosphodiesterase class II)